MPSEKFQTVVAQVKAKSEFVETVKRACLALIEPSRTDKGCLNYDLYQSTEDPTIFIFYENWESLARSRAPFGIASCTRL